MLAIKRKCTDFGPPEGKRFYKIVPVYLLFLIGPPTLVGAGPIRSPPLFIIILFRVDRDPFFSKMALTIFLKLGMVVNIDANKKVTKPDYPKNFCIIQEVPKCGQNYSFLTFSQKWL